MADTKSNGRTAQLPYTTRLGISEKDRHQIVELLNATLAASSDLYSQTKQAHWNVKGKDFYQLHLLYDELAEKLEEPIDTIAERIVLLGGYAFGTVRMAAQASIIDPFPGTDQDGEGEDALNDPSFLTTLADRWAQYADHIRESNKASDEIGDPGTTDLYDAITHIAERGTWFIEGHLQRYHGGLSEKGQDPS